MFFLFRFQHVLCLNLNNDLQSIFVSIKQFLIYALITCGWFTLNPIRINTRLKNQHLLNKAENVIILLKIKIYF